MRTWLTEGHTGQRTAGLVAAVAAGIARRTGRQEMEIPGAWHWQLNNGTVSAFTRHTYALTLVCVRCTVDPIQFITKYWILYALFRPMNITYKQYAIIIPFLYFYKVWIRIIIGSWSTISANQSDILSHYLDLIATCMSLFKKWIKWHLSKFSSVNVILVSNFCVAIDYTIRPIHVHYKYSCYIIRARPQLFYLRLT